MEETRYSEKEENPVVLPCYATFSWAALYPNNAALTTTAQPNCQRRGVNGP